MGEEESIKDESVKSEQSAATKEHKESVHDHKDHSRPESKPVQSKSDDDDLKFDFSKFNIFKKKDKSSVKSEEKKPKKDEDDDLSLDSKSIDSVKSFLSRYWAYFLIIIPIFLVIFVRMQATSLVITDEWAHNSVISYYQNQITTQEKLQNPNLPDTYLQQRVAQKLKDFENANKADILANEQQLSDNIRQHYQYQSGSSSYPYMGDIDSYYWLRFARNLEQKAQYCDQVENGSCYDTYTIAPDRLKTSQDLHPYLILYNYKILKMFNNDMTLMQAQILVPTILSVLAAILIFLMMNRAFGPLAGLVASIMISVNPIFLSRSLGSDTDVYNIFFPVLIIFFIFEAILSRDLIKKSILASLAGISLGIYSFAWQGGWWYLFDFIIIAIIADFAFYFVKDAYHSKRLHVGLFTSDKAKLSGAMLGSFLIFSVIVLSLVAGSINIITVPFTSPFGFLHAKAAANPTLWPNVLTTVAEFNPASLSDITNQMLGPAYFFLALLGFIILLFKDSKKVKENLVYFWSSVAISVAILIFLISSFGSSLSATAYLVLLIVPFLIGILYLFLSNEDIDVTIPTLFFIWIAASIFAALTGVRFTLLLVAPVGIGIGITLGYLYTVLTDWMSSSFHVKKIIMGSILFLLFCLLLIGPVRAGIYTAKNYVPNVDDQWYDDLTKIKESSQPDAIINSWWDFGHWFKYIADRRVTLDGSSQNLPQLHWLGKTLLTSSDAEAKGILRMLDCGANKAFDAIDKKIQNPLVSKRILDSIIVEDRSSAKLILLEKGFSDSESESILDLSHCNPPEDFFITSEDMVGKGGVWAHFGSWSFDRAWMHQTYDKSASQDAFIEDVTKELNITREQAKEYYVEISNLNTDREVNDWVAPWPSYIQDETACQDSQDSITCPFRQSSYSVNVVVNKSSMEAYLPTPDGSKYLDTFGYTTSTGMKVKTYSASTLGVGMLLMRTKEGYSAVFMSPQLVNSTFTKLYYLDGHGTKYFDPFSSTVGMNSFKNKIWKVNWNSDKTLIVDRFVITKANTTVTNSTTSLPDVSSQANKTVDGSVNSSSNSSAYSIG